MFCLVGEAARIHKYKGRVFALQDEPEVARVWLPNSDSPGLAMARAFGDFCLKDFGLISVPDVYYHRITDRNEFVVLATDGVLISPNIISLQKENSISSLRKQSLNFTFFLTWLNLFPFVNT